MTGGRKGKLMRREETGGITKEKRRGEERGGEKRKKGLQKIGCHNTRHGDLVPLLLLENFFEFDVYFRRYAALKFSGKMHPRI